MLKMRKILSVALVVVMLLSTVAINSFALADGKEVGFVIKADKTVDEIVPGAAVTVTLYYEMSDYTQLMSDLKLCLLYDSTVYTPDTTTRTFVGDLAGYAKDTTVAVINANFAKTCMNASSMTAEEKAKYDNGLMLTVGPDATNLGSTSKAGYSITEGENGLSIAECTIVFNVTGDAAAIAAGNVNITIPDNTTAQYVKKTTGSATPTKITNFDISRANILANMPAKVASILTPMSSQIRFKGVKTEADFADYNALVGDAKTFDVRTRATIAKADFDATFGTEEAAKACEFGFIYKATSNGAFDYETAKGVAQGTAATDYVKYECNYLQRTAEGYNFTCLITGIVDNAESLADGVTCIAYVCVNGEYIFFDAADVTTASYGDLYNAWHK